MLAAARLMGCHDTQLWRTIQPYVEQTRARADHSNVTRTCVDEAAARRGHDYISLFVDIDARRVLFVADGKDANRVKAFADDLAAHGGNPEHIEEVCIDMSQAFIKGTAEHFPEAQVTFDKFHAVKLVNDAVDQVRRDETKTRPELKRTRYSWLKNPRNLSAEQATTLDGLTRTNLKTVRAYRLRLAFQDIYAEPARFCCALDRRCCGSIGRFGGIVPKEVDRNITTELV